MAAKKTEERDVIPKLTLSATLPVSGKVVVMREPDATSEMLCAGAVGNADGYKANVILVRERILRAIESIDGKQFDSSMHTGDTLRDEFDARDWRCLVLQIDKLTAPEVAEEAKFLETFTFGT